MFKLAIRDNYKSYQPVGGVARHNWSFIENLRYEDALDWFSKISQSHKCNIIDDENNSIIDNF